MVVGGGRWWWVVIALFRRCVARLRSDDMKLSDKRHPPLPSKDIGSIFRSDSAANLIALSMGLKTRNDITHQKTTKSGASTGIKQKEETEEVRSLGRGGDPEVRHPPHFFCPLPVGVPPPVVFHGKMHKHEKI